MVLKKSRKRSRLFRLCILIFFPALILVLIFSGPVLAAPVSRFLSNEFGPNDFQISDMAAHLTPNYNAGNPSVAYNTARDEFLVVWNGPNQHRTFGYWYQDTEIWYQQVSDTGEIIGVNEKLTQTGPYEDITFFARNPDVAYNPFRDEYVIVWDDNGRECGEDKKFDIHGQRLIYDEDGYLTPIGGIKDISIMGPRPVSCSYHAYKPAVAYNWINNEYMVVWEGSHHAGDLVAGEFEIWGQRLNAVTLDRVGDMVRISFMGPDGNTNYIARNPDIDHNRYPSYNEYLVVWEGDTTGVSSLVDNEFEIWSERVTASGTRSGTLRLSDTGGLGNPSYDASEPAVVFNSNKNRWLAVWSADENYSPLGDQQFEIFGQQLKYNTSNNLVGVGPNDFRISHMGPDGLLTYEAFYPAVVYDIVSNHYIVVWQGRDGIPPDADWFEIYGQRIQDEPTEAIGPHDFRISDMGPAGNNDYFARRPAIASGGFEGYFLATWEGTDPPHTVINDWEIFGQLFRSLTDTYLPLIYQD